MEYPLILPPAKRILFTSSREHTDREFIKRHLTPFWRPRITLVHGACKGGDMIADDIWRSWGGLTELHPVLQDHWDFYGLAAGPLRNAHMVDLGADKCLAFPIGRSKGTRGCYRLAKDAGIPSEMFEYPDCRCAMCNKESSCGWG